MMVVAEGEDTGTLEEVLLLQMARDGTGANGTDPC